ncbi:MAG: hypothetical protein J5644_04685 [Bacteroidales bacterium]|nr:hypothetical protein [Bacteroidales bacterium]
MKKIGCLLIGMWIMCWAMGQQVINGVYQGSPPTFMLLPTSPIGGGSNWNNSWVKPGRANTGAYSSITRGVTLSGDFTHRFITTNDSTQSPRTNPCFRVLQGASSYGNKAELAPSWNSDKYPGTYVDSIIQMGGPSQFTNRGDYAQEIIYSFVPDTNNPVLLLNFAFATEGIYHSEWAPRNPGVEFALLEHSTNDNNSQYLQLGTYPNGSQKSRFWFGTAKGASGSQELVAGDPDPRNTPVPNQAYAPGPIPRASNCQCGYSTIQEINTFPYTVVAFDLTNQARAGTAVDFRVREWSCNANVHWAFCYFTAKMVPGKLKVEYCGGDELNLSVPWGFETYKWYNGTDANDMRRIYPTDYDPYDAQNPNYMNLPGTSVYHPKLKPNPRKPYFRCEAMSFTGVEFVYEATVNYYDLRPAFIATPRAISDSVKDCKLSVVIHDTSKIAIIKADPTKPDGLDTTTVDMKLKPELCTWNWGDGSPEEHGFAPSHVYPDTGTYVISLFIQDPDRICLSDTVRDTVRVIREYTIPTDTLKDTVVTCESKLPYRYKPARFGPENEYTRWDLQSVGERLVSYMRFNALPDTLKAVDGSDSLVYVRSWNGCDSIERVQFEVLTPKVIIQQEGDFCDSAKVLLWTRVSNVEEDSVIYQWSYRDTKRDTDTLPELWAISDGIYNVSIIDKSTMCEAEAAYKVNPCVPNVFLPNCITPTNISGDETSPLQNDYLYLDEFVLRFISELKFTVFSRNGEQVYYYEGKKDPDGKFQPQPKFEKLPDVMANRLVLWDGKIKGEVRDGTYVYTLWIVSGGQTYLYKGRLMVM